MQSAVVARLVDQPLALLGLILVLLLLAVLSRVRDGRRQVMAAWLPRLLLLRIAVVAALLAAALTCLGAEGEWLKWVGVAADLSLELALINFVFTLVWRIFIIAGAFNRAQPEILCNIFFYFNVSGVGLVAWPAGHVDQLELSGDFGWLGVCARAWSLKSGGQSVVGPDVLQVERHLLWATGLRWRAGWAA